MIKSQALFIILYFGLVTQNLFSQQPINLSGYIETTYNYNFAKGYVNSLRSYDYKSNQILLNNVHIEASGNPSDKLTYNIDFDFGTDATVHGLLNQGILLTGTPIGVDIDQAYFTYSISHKLKFTAGRFVSFEGIEVIEGPSNPTISRGYLYGLAEPFTNAGGYFTLIPNDIIDFKFGVVNGWDLLVDNNPYKTIISRIGINLGDPLTAGISFYSGVEQDSTDNWRNSFDFTGVTKVIQNVALNFQANYGTETINTANTKWFGFTIQPVISLSPNVSLGLRGEYFADDQGARSGIPDLKALNLTIVPGFKFDGLNLRVEYRFDNSNKPVFWGKTETFKYSDTISFELSSEF